MQIIIKYYLNELKKKYRTGLSTEATHYSALQSFLESIAEQCSRKVNIIRSDKRTDIGIPDFWVFDKENITIANVEAKDIGEELSSIARSEQLKRYKEFSPNLILTNYLQFWLFREGKKIKEIELLDYDEFQRKTRFSIKQPEKVADFFETFYSYEPSVAFTPKDLALQLARRTKLLATNIEEILKQETEREKGRLYENYKAFREHLISDMKLEDFSDMYAQTISYGLFLARINADEALDRSIAHRNIPRSISLLNELFKFLAEDDLPQELKWIVEDISSLLNKADIENILRKISRHTGEEDPIIYFYETFLEKYNPRLRKGRGIYYTPVPVVSFIVSSINLLLKEKFNKPLGLAESSVKILDPACGTGTFLASVINTIHQEIMHSSRSGLFPDVVRDHILEEIYGFELLMAPYAIAHLKLTLLLKELGYKLSDEERFKIYLTNTLESKDVTIRELPFIESLTRESAAAQDVKERVPILVVLANPPYSVSSYNKSDFIEDLMDDYKEDVRKERNIQPLSDDYIKFIRFAHWKIEQGGRGIFAYISNNSFLSGLIHRGMRRKLLESFDEIYILNLHGNANIGETCPDGSKDENVFDIRQGVGISIFVKLPEKAKDKKIYYYDLYGLRKDKGIILSQNNIKSLKWEALQLKPKNFFFTIKDSTKEEYYYFWSIIKIFNKYSSGVKSHRDHFILGFDQKELFNNIKTFKNENLSITDVSHKFKLRNTRDWNIKEARKKLKIDKNDIIIYDYRPFDKRFIYYNKTLIDRGCSRFEIMKNLFKANLALCTLKSTQIKKAFTNVFITKNISDIHFASDQSYVFPLYLYNKEKGLFKENDNLRKSNLKPEFLDALELCYEEMPSPEQIMFYCYGILHSQAYRKDYEDFLRIDFPRVPFTRDYKYFQQIATVGEELGRLHLLESPLLDKIESEYPISGNHLVEKPNYDEKKQRLYINEREYFGKVPPDVWEFMIGGYQVLRQYLKYRKGRNLSYDEINHLLKVITAIKHTIRIMPQCDKLFKKINLKKLIK